MTDPLVRKPTRRAHRILRAHPSDSCPLALLWSFRLMVELQGYRKLLRRHEIADDEVAEALGLGDWIDNDDYRPGPAPQPSSCARRTERSAPNMRIPNSPSPWGVICAPWRA